MKEEINPLVAGGIVLGLVVVVGLIVFLKGALGSKPGAEVNRQNAQIMQNMRDASKAQGGGAPPPGTMMAPPPGGTGMAPAPGMGMAPPPPGGMAPAPAGR